VIIINYRIFIIGFIIGLIIFSIFNFVYVNDENNGIYNIDNKKNKSFYVEPSEKNAERNKGFYRQSLVTNFEPGIYNIKVESVGKNITLILKSSYEEKKIKFNDSAKTKLRIENSVWLAFMIEEPPTIQYTEEIKNRFDIHFIKNQKTSISVNKILLIITTTGGVLFAANEARIYSKKR